jgi:MurNAc alpha-1-phosphate uridylyltransferase
MFAGAQILHPRLFAAAPTGPFSLNLLYDRAQALGRPHGLRHDGHWLHIGTPEALRDAERTLARLP